MASIGGLNNSASSSLTLLQSMASSTGIMSSLTASNAIPPPTISTLGVSGGGATAAENIQQIARNQSVLTQKNNIYKIIGDRINAISTGQLKPSADWEKLAGYYTGIGKPFVVSLSAKGQPVITPQDQMDASRYSVTQRNALGAAVSSLLDLGPQVQANTDYDKLKNQWDSISVNLVDIKNNVMIPTTDWQQKAASILATNHPISFSLDPNGTVSVEDQTISTFQDKDPAVRNALVKASRMAADAVSTDLAYNRYLAQGIAPPQAMEDKEARYSQYSWVAEASSFASMGIPYTLGADATQKTCTVNYVTKSEKTTYSNGLPNASSSFTINNNGQDGFGLPDTTTDAANPQPFAANNQVTTAIAGIVDGAGQPITPIKYANPVNIVSNANNQLAVTDTVTGNTDNFTYDGAGTLTVATTNKAGTQIGLNSYSATGLSAVASKPPTITMVDAAGKNLAAPVTGTPFTYTNDVTVNKIDQYNTAVTDTASGNVDTYSIQLDASNTPIADSNGNFSLTLTHTDSLGRTRDVTQNLTTSAAGVNTIVASSNSTTIAADGSGTVSSISRSTILPIDKFAGATGANGNRVSNIITDGSGTTLGAYGSPVSITNDGVGNITVTDKQSGKIDTYTDNGNNTISISHHDSAGNVISAGSSVAGVGLNALVAQTPTISFTDGSGNPVLDSNGAPLPTYTGPVTFTDNSTSPDKDFRVTDTTTGYIDHYSYTDSTGALSVTHYDNQGNALYSQNASGVTGFKAASSAQTITDASGGPLTDTLGNAPPSYTTPVSFKDSGGGNFSITDSSTGNVDAYAFDSQANTLTITHNDASNTLLSTQSFTGVSGIGKPWISLAEAGSSSWAVTPPAASVTASAGGALTDSLGGAAPSYTSPITIQDSGAGNFSVTNTSTGYVDVYAYDSAAQTLSITHNDNASNTLSTQSFSGVSGIATPWAAQQAANPTAWSVSPPNTGITDPLGGTLTDTLGTDAPTYTNPVTVADSGGGNFSITDTTTGYVDLYAYDSAAQTMSITHNDNANNTLSTQSFTGVSGIATPWDAQQAASPTAWAITPPPAGITDAGGGALTDTLGGTAPAYTDPITVSDQGGGKFSVTNTATGYVDHYAYDSAAQTLSITHNDNANTTLSVQNFTGLSGIAWLGVPAASLLPATPTTWDVFNKTTLNTTLASNTSYNTSYDTSNFDMTNPTSHVEAANAYTSNTTFSYTNNNVLSPTLMQSALPNLKLNYVVEPTITVMPVTNVPMPTSVEPATTPYNLNTTQMDPWKKDAIGFMKAGTPFMLDFDPQGHIVAKKVTGDNIIKFNNPQLTNGGYNPNASSQSNYYGGVASLLSTIA